MNFSSYANHGANPFDSFNPVSQHMLSTFATNNQSGNFRNNQSPSPSLSSGPLIEKPIWTNTGQVLHDNIKPSVLNENLRDYNITIDSDDRTLDIYPNPFSYVVMFKSLGKSVHRNKYNWETQDFPETPAPVIMRTFKNVKYVKIETIILSQFAANKYIVEHDIRIKSNKLRSSIAINKVHHRCDLNNTHTREFCDCLCVKCSYAHKCSKCFDFDSDSDEDSESTSLSNDSSKSPCQPNNNLESTSSLNNSLKSTSSSSGKLDLTSSLNNSLKSSLSSKNSDLTSSSNNSLKSPSASSKNLDLTSSLNNSLKSTSSSSGKLDLTSSLNNSLKSTSLSSGKLDLTSSLNNSLKSTSSSDVTQYECECESNNICNVCNNRYCRCALTNRNKFLILKIKELQNNRIFSTNTLTSDYAFPIYVDKNMGDSYHTWKSPQGITTFIDSQLFNLDRLTIEICDNEGKPLQMVVIIQYNIIINKQSHKVLLVFGQAPKDIRRNLPPNCVELPLKELFDPACWFARIINKISSHISDKSVLEILRDNTEDLCAELSDTDLFDIIKKDTSNNIFLTVGVINNDFNTSVKYEE